jgi:hypothetical protein
MPFDEGQQQLPQPRLKQLHACAALAAAATTAAANCAAPAAAFLSADAAEQERVVQGQVSRVTYKWTGAH